MFDLMTLDYFLTALFYLILTLYLIRGMFNWVLLNLVEGTSHPRISLFASPKDLILTINHMARSFLKPWWKGEDYKTMKAISNVLSGMLYAAIAILVIVFIVGYKL